MWVELFGLCVDRCLLQMCFSSEWTCWQRDSFQPPVGKKVMKKNEEDEIIAGNKIFTKKNRFLYKLYFILTFFPIIPCYSRWAQSL